ncbi:Effector protein NopP [Mesorhizobium amorphae]|uniref:Effector protein NopP n=1 Tax=Mesorhizobium amorphae TaxID=71433 RepID=UPI001FCB22C2|nr:Effector protein NopP [Mesorhizobium amorphae]
MQTLNAYRQLVVSLRSARLTIIPLESPPTQWKTLPIGTRSMHSRISCSSNTQSARAGDVDNARWSATSAAQAGSGGHGFAEILAVMHLEARESRASSSSAAPLSSSSAATPSYALVPRPPVVEISRSSFEKKAKAFYGDEMVHIASKPQEYSTSLSSKARRTVEIADQYGTTRFDTEQARYFSYQLGSQSVGLLRTEGGDSMGNLFEGEKWRELFPGRTEVTSIVDLRVTHPLVENAGDILLEHQLRLDGDRPLLNSCPANPQAKERAMAMGFVAVDDFNMVLDPTQHPDKWTKNSDGEWQRAGKPAMYLSKADDSEGSDTESVVTTAADSCDDDFM